jgi:uncharacterized membrane protein YhfC
MNLRRMMLAVAVTFVTSLAWSALYHLVLLRDADAAIRHLYRPDMADKMGLSLLGLLGVCAFFVAGYALCARRGTVLEGLAYGLGFAVLASLLVDLNQYVLYPVPGALILKWTLGGLVEFLLNGVWVSLIVPVGGRRSPER